MRKPIHRFRRDSRGSIAVTFVIAFTVLAAAVAAAIDYSSYISARARTQAALDATALWLAQQPRFRSGREDDAAALKEAFTSNIGNAGGMTHEKLHSRWSGETLVVSVQLTSPGALSRSVSFGAITGEVATTVTWSEQAIEVALVIDTSKKFLSSAKKLVIPAAVDTFLATLPPGRAKVGVVPFSSTVNPGNAISVTMLDTAADATHHGVSFDEAAGPVNHFTLFSQLGLSPGTCVEARPSPLDESDAAANPSDPDTLFVPYLDPDGGKGSYLNISDLPARPPSPLGKGYTGDPAVYTASRLIDPDGPQRGCTPNRILDLTSDFAAVRSHVQHLTYQGGSLIPLGAVWAWRLLSPSPPFTRGRPYQDTNTKKVIVFMTDGADTYKTGDYTAYGHMKTGRIVNSTSAKDIDVELDAKTIRICKNAKDAGIDIFVVGIDLDLLDAASRARVDALVKACTEDDPAAMIGATATEAANALGLIGERLSGLRIVR